MATRGDSSRDLQPHVYIEIINYLIPHIRKLAAADGSMREHKNHLVSVYYEEAGFHDWSKRELSLQDSVYIETPLAARLTTSLRGGFINEPEALLLSALTIVDYAKKMLSEGVETSQEALIAIQRVEALWEQDLLRWGIREMRNYRLHTILITE